MNFDGLKNFIDAFHSKVEAQCTGNPDTFSKQLGVSRATLYRYIDNLALHGVEVKFNRTHNTFYYAKPARVELVIEGSNYEGGGVICI